ncbi:hypothetical protein ACU8MB_15030 [Rhizobium leguminosarum]
MQESNHERPVPEGPQIKAETWFALAIAGFFITLTVFSGVAIWVFTGEPSLVLQRAQAFTPFGGALIATVTFCTIAWRGVLNTKQLEYQAEQIRHQAEQLGQTRRQNDAKDDENLAKLLMDGTKLLGEERESHVLAGVAALQAVVTSPRGAFSSQAMDILADLVEATYSDLAKAKIFDAAREAVNLGAAAGRMSTRTLRLTFADGNKRWVYAINGVARVTYQSAEIDDMEYVRFVDLNRVRFEGCEFTGVTVDGNHRNFVDCILSSCEIRTMTSGFLIKNAFDNCDFSGARFTGPRPVRKKDRPHPWQNLRDRGNWFRQENPIIGDARIVWEDFFEQVVPMPVDYDPIEQEDLTSA